MSPMWHADDGNGLTGLKSSLRADIASGVRNGLYYGGMAALLGLASYCRTGDQNGLATFELISGMAFLICSGALVGAVAGALKRYVVGYLSASIVGVVSVVPFAVALNVVGAFRSVGAAAGAWSIAMFALLAGTAGGIGIHNASLRHAKRSPPVSG